MLASDVVRLDILLEHVRTLGISRLILKVLLLLLSQLYSPSSILCRVVHSMGVSKAVVQWLDLQVDLVAEVLCSHPPLRQDEFRLEFSL